MPLASSSLPGSTADGAGAFTATAGLLAHAPIVSDLFDITSVYFPISFSPPPGDKHGFTRGGLVTELRALLTASNTSQVHSLLAPLCMEKLTSSVDNARWDAAETMALVARDLAPPMLAKYAPAVAESVCKLLASAASSAG